MGASVVRVIFLMKLVELILRGINILHDPSELFVAFFKALFFRIELIFCRLNRRGFRLSRIRNLFWLFFALCGFLALRAMRASHLS